MKQIPPLPSETAAAAHRPRPPLLVLVWVLAIGLLAAAWLGGDAAWGMLGLVLVSSVAFLPALRRGNPVAWLGWTVSLAALGWLTLRGHGWTVLELLPAVVNAALCLLFVTSLRGPASLIERVIVAIEGIDHLALPGVRRYARRLTAAWALLFGLQALALALSHLVLATGMASPRWQSLLHGYQAFGCHLLVIGFMLIEHRLRRLLLPQVAHRSLPGFLHALLRCWPEVAGARARPGAGHEHA